MTMKIIKTISEIMLNEASAVALGLFDGVHLAHRAVIAELLRSGLKTVVFTFSTQSKMPPNKNGGMILSENERRAKFAEMGVDVLISPPFDELCELDYRAFFDILKNQLNAEMLSCGYDYTFGRNKEGSVQKLRELCGEDIVLKILPEMKLNGEAVRSSRIKAMLFSGDIKNANALLGYEYYTVGRVEHGNNIGHTIGFPTINQKLDKSLAIPKFGVYKTTAVIDGAEHKGVTNIGVKPTVGGVEAPVIETYIIDYSDDLYGKEVKIIYHDFIRPEQKFSSLEQLKIQLGEDIEKAKEGYSVD